MRTCSAYRTLKHVPDPLSPSSEHTDSKQATFELHYVNNGITTCSTSQEIRNRHPRTEQASVTSTCPLKRHENTLEAGIQVGAWRDAWLPALDTVPTSDLRQATAEAEATSTTLHQECLLLARAAVESEVSTKHCPDQG